MHTYLSMVFILDGNSDHVEHVLTLSAMGGYGPIFQSAMRGDRNKFLDFFIGTFAIESFVRSSIFRYG